MHDIGPARAAPFLRAKLPAGSQLGAMRARLVVECGDQRVQTVTATPTVVETAATICAPVGAAAPWAPSVNPVWDPGFQHWGICGRPGLGATLTAGHPLLAGGRLSTHTRPKLANASPSRRHPATTTPR